MIFQAVLLLGIRETLTKYGYVEAHMGTRCRIDLYAVNKERADRAAKLAYARIAQLNDILSDYKPDSELNRLCKLAGGPAIQVSAELFTVLEEAARVSELSSGAFDVTVGPHVRLWRQARKTQLMPSPVRLTEAKTRTGYKKLVLDPKKRSVQLLVSGMQLDLGGIAKGFAADEALIVLKQLGITSALVAIGGDIAVSEPPPLQKSWVVGIANLGNPSDKPSQWVGLANQAISTSGDAEQHVEIGGIRYSHIVDPRTGIGLTGERSVTIIAKKGIQSDSLSKVASVLEPADSLRILKQIPGVHVQISRRAKGEILVKRSAGFSQYLTPAP